MRPITDPFTRFIEKILATPDGCWQWAASKSRGGYGQFKTQGKVKRAHRVAYEFFMGAIPEGLQIDHLCRNRGCVNPLHLEPVTAKVNIHRSEGLAAKNIPKTHCPRGHCYSGRNLIMYENRRYCRECTRIRNLT